MHMHDERPIHQKAGVEEEDEERESINRNKEKEAGQREVEGCRGFAGIEQCRRRRRRRLVCFFLVLNILRS